MTKLFISRGKAIASTLLLALLVNVGANAADAPKPATAATPPAGPPQKVAVLDMASALFNSDRAKVLESELQKQTADDQAKIRSLAEEGKKLQDQMKKDEATMSDDAKRKNQEKIQEIGVQYQYLVDKIQKLFQDRRQQFQEAYAPQLVQAISDVVKEGGYDMVFRTESVLYFGNSGYDITAKVTEKLNKQK